MSLSVEQVKQAIEKDQLVPYFQPLVELGTGKLSGVEVLARWQHPEQGPVLPANFIALAETNGLIDALMDQVFRKAFHAVSQLSAPLDLAVNISPLQLRDPDLPLQIRRLLDASSLSPDCLTIEITETAIVKDLHLAQSIVRRFKDMGCRMALDDFGTGCSSLSHLQAFPFDELKIDRSFVDRMVRTREGRKIVASIIDLGHSLNLVSVAEGIETEHQADMLLWLGCQLGQGWLYGRPMPQRDLPALLAAPPSPIAAGLTSPGDGWAVSSLEALPTQRLAQLQAIYEGSPVALCFLDRNLRYISLNQRLADLSDRTIASYLGKTVEETHPELFTKYQSYLHRALQGEAITGAELSQPSSTPTQHDDMLLASFQPAWDEADEVIGISIALISVTDQKRGIEGLLERQDPARDLAALEDQVPWIMDPEGNALQLSSKWVLQNAVVRHPRRNLNWLEAVHVEDLEQVMSTMKSALRTGTPIDIEYRVVGLDGQLHWMRSRGSARLGPSGEIIRWYGSVEDIDLERQPILASLDLATQPSN